MKMVNSRDQAKFERAQWLFKVFIPCWMIQISLFIILVGTSSYLLSNAIKDNEEERGTAVAWECIIIAAAVVSTLCTAYEIFKMTAEALTPRDVMISNLVKLVGTILAIIMDSVMAGTTMWKWATGAQALHALLIVSILIQASYGAWKWRRLSQYDDYHHPANVKPFGFKSDLKNKSLHSRNLSDEDWDVELRAEWAPAGDATMENAVDANSPAPVATSPEPTPAGTRERGSSFMKMGGRLDFSLSRDVNKVNEDGQNHSRSNSASALMNIDTSYEPQTQIPKIPNEPTQPAAAARTTSPPAVSTRKRAPSYVSMTGTGLDRRVSYNHTRDTSFDEYVQQRRKASQGQHKSQGSNSSSASGSASSRTSVGPRGPVAPPSRSRSNTDLEAAQLRLTHLKRQQDLKDDVDEALGAEFGWGVASRTSSQDSIMAGGHPPAIAVAGGAVPNAKSVRTSLGRAPSDGSEAGVLGAVPERREDEFEVAGAGAGVGEDGRALLSGQEGGDIEGDRDGEMHPAALRRSTDYGRPRGLSETIEFVVTPPPKTPTEERREMRMTWGAAYHRP
ncbi:hypothetical protein VP1G_03747 [Cytospora mali]|uniref:Uncharacterized protein n=1 Tax=Cytospora mali TaxID=578113 RepID=A0A194UX88_CYTMA|nr:hypothetical protein VP1G_03747 [Valsa mali var. pyri (nom. inval.)]